jgi:protocatechuate 3,4-dioxygenase beta subunit
MTDPIHAHGLRHDLPAMAALLERRRALKWCAGAGTLALVAGCGGESETAGATTTGATATAPSTPTPTATGSTSGTAAGCIADPTETSGPFPADGTNTASGLTSNALTATGVVRSDIRPSFLGSSTAVAPGVATTLTITLVNVNATCAPLAGYAIYVWHCSAAGEYSLYDLPQESYLRGAGVTDANGQVSFTTVVPGCYAGRYPHIHFEVFSSLSTATGGRYASLISQLAIPAAVCDAVYADTATYGGSATNFARVSIASDGVFGDNSAAQIAQQTATMTGTPAIGYAANVIVGLAR